MDNFETEFTAHLFTNGTEREIAVRHIEANDADYFRKNNIKVSMEELKGEFIVYACPYSDESEESEILVLADGRDCVNVLRELAEQSIVKFGDVRCN